MTQTTDLAITLSGLMWATGKIFWHGSFYEQCRDQRVSEYLARGKFWFPSDDTGRLLLRRLPWCHWSVGDTAISVF